MVALSTLFLVALFLLCSFSVLEANCRSGCGLALASYYVWPGSNLTYISTLFNQKISDILHYNPQIPNQGSTQVGTRINVPFSCDCIEGVFLGHAFTYTTRRGDTYDKIARVAFANLTNRDWIQRFNSIPRTNITINVDVNVTVNCSCGDPKVSTDYGLFSTYPLQPSDNLSSLAAESGVSSDLLRRYNPVSDFGAGAGIVFVPAKDERGTFPPFKARSTGVKGGIIAAISVTGVVGALLLAFYLYTRFFYRRKKPVSGGTFLRTDIIIDKSLQFSCRELASATNNFSIANKIGQGGFGTVYYGLLRGEKAAIKKMNIQASKEFLAELKVLTRVHHSNLVRLIGYCVEGSLFLVYEFIENGNLSQHLRGRDSLSWPSRVQIALDSARGLEYLHEYAVSVYVHRDIKAANILIDDKFHAKVADFGLAKLTGVGPLRTHPVGTFGYMSPEYAQYGNISPKIDVYAFGVVLYELISAKEAVVRTEEFVTEPRALIALFEDVLGDETDPKEEDLRKLIDPKLGDAYPLDSVRKMSQLARACTQKDPQLRPNMRSVVVALMTLSSCSMEDRDMGYEIRV